MGNRIHAGRRVQAGRRHLGQRLREARLKRGWSQWQLALRSGIAPTLLSQYERGVITPSTESVKKLARVLGVSADYLLGLEGASEAHDSAPSKGGEQHADH
jgi:transcriptional regulator with XRE-family HTH domain